MTAFQTLDNIQVQGKISLSLADYESAIKDSKQALANNPNDADAYLNQGVARSLSGDKQGAIADLQKAADLFQQQGRTQDSQKVLAILTEIR